MCVPEPGLLADDGPRVWPGRARVDMMAGSSWLKEVDRFCCLGRR